MKIGIITFHSAPSYGAVLQSFGLYRKLEELFPLDEIYIVDYRPDCITDTLFKWKNIITFISSIIRLPFSIKRKILFYKFKKKFFEFITIKNIQCLDYLICGSDQIWNPQLTNGIDPYYFGVINGFNGKIISYAASDGGSIGDISSGILKKYLTSLTGLSVREHSMLPIVKQYNRNAAIVVDPVFLFDKEFWANFSSKRKFQGYILIYFVSPKRDDRLLEDAYKLARKKNKKVIEITAVFPTKGMLNSRKKHKIIPCVSIPDFLSYFLYAEYIFTDSFHGTAFSIIFNKNFYTYKSNEKNYDRIHTVLSESALLNHEASCFSLEIEKDIDYTSVNKYIMHRRDESITFLKKNII